MKRRGTGLGRQWPVARGAVAPGRGGRPLSAGAVWEARDGIYLGGSLLSRRIESKKVPRTCWKPGRYRYCEDRRGGLGFFVSGPGQ
jgi:hypothetical protein